MKYSIIPILLLITCFASKSVIAQEFWGETNYGDSEEKIKSLHPDFSQHISTKELEDIGFSSLIEVKTVLAEQKFNAYFYFVSKQLDSVILKSEKLLTEAESDAFTQLIIPALRNKFGSAGRVQNPALAASEGLPMWFEFINNETRILFVEQNEKDKIMISYRLSDEEKERLSKIERQKILKKVDVKKLSESL